jgi:hypothetical protein
MAAVAGTSADESATNPVVFRTGPTESLRWLASGPEPAVPRREQVIRRRLTQLPIGWCSVTARGRTAITASARDWIAEHGVVLGVDDLTAHTPARLSPRGVVDAHSLLNDLET